MGIETRLDIILGYPGSGKSTFGRQHCNETGALLVDEDQPAVDFEKGLTGEYVNFATFNPFYLLQRLQKAGINQERINFSLLMFFNNENNARLGSALAQHNHVVLVSNRFGLPTERGELLKKVRATTITISSYWMDLDMTGSYQRTIARSSAIFPVTYSFDEYSKLMRNIQKPHQGESIDKFFVVRNGYAIEEQAGKLTQASS